MAPTYELSCLDNLPHPMMGAHPRLGPARCGRKQGRLKAGILEGFGDWFLCPHPALKHFCIKLSPCTLLNRQHPHSMLLPQGSMHTIRYNPMSQQAMAPPLNYKDFSCQPNISSSCRNHEEMANKERDLITGNKTKDTDSLIFFVLHLIAINSRHLTQ